MGWLTMNRVPEVTVPCLRADPSAGELLTYGFALSVDRLFTNLSGIDDESIHQARVATRRLRSNLRTFGSLLPEERKGLRRDLGALGGLLGEVRDRDVFMRRVSGSLAAEGSAVPALLRVWSRRREQACGRLARYLGTEGFETIATRLARWAQVVPLARSGSALELAVPLVRKRWERLASAVDRDPQGPDALHRVRILAKRVRYGAELVAPAAGRRAAQFAAAAEGLQDVLGEYRDAMIAHDTLVRVGRGVPPRWSTTFGELAGVELASRNDAESRWPDAFRALDRRKLRRWM
jgi:CHAD domain-containing protein